jgi:hypothetical protein
MPVDKGGNIYVKVKTVEPRNGESESEGIRVFAGKFQELLAGSMSEKKERAFNSLLNIPVEQSGIYGGQVAWKGELFLRNSQQEKVICCTCLFCDHLSNMAWFQVLAPASPSPKLSPKAGQGDADENDCDDDDDDDKATWRYANYNQSGSDPKFLAWLAMEVGAPEAPLEVSNALEAWEREQINCNIRAEISEKFTKGGKKYMFKDGLWRSNMCI